MLAAVCGRALRGSSAAGVALRSFATGPAVSSTGPVSDEMLAKLSE